MFELHELQEEEKCLSESNLLKKVDTNGCMSQWSECFHCWRQSQNQLVSSHKCYHATDAFYFECMIRANWMNLTETIHRSLDHLWMCFSVKWSRSWVISILEKISMLKWWMQLSHILSAHKHTSERKIGVRSMGEARNFSATNAFDLWFGCGSKLDRSTVRLCVHSSERWTVALMLKI